MLWREFYSIGRTGTANKTNYVPMAIMRVFWGLALEPNLRELYHSLRAIPMSKKGYVGWDTPIEWLNGAITEMVPSKVSEERISRAIRNHSTLQANYFELLGSLGGVHSA